MNASITFASEAPKRIGCTSVSLAIPAGILTAFLFSMLWIGGASIDIWSAVLLFGGAVIVVAAGDISLMLAGLDTISASLPVAIVMGLVMTSLVLLAVVLTTGLPAGTAFLGWSAVVVSSVIITWRKVSWRSRSAIDYAVVASLAVLVAFWCRHSAAAIPTLQTTHVLPLWSDYYIHAATIAQFSSVFAVGRGAIELAGQPLPLYHYVGYMVAAAVGGITDLPSLILASSVLLPAGLLVAALGSYALAVDFAGPLAGVIAIAFLALLPDSSFYGLANGFFGFHWLLFTAPGSGYALGATAVALLMANEWLRHGNRYALAYALSLVAAVFGLRAHFIPLLVPAFTMMLACEIAFVRGHARLLLWVALGGCVLVLTLLLAVPPVRFFWLEHSAVLTFLEFSHSAQAPTAYDGLYLRHIASVGHSLALAFGTILLFPAILGGFVLLYPMALVAWVRRTEWQISDLFPLLLLVCFVTVVVFAPVAPNGDPTEFQHRPFVLIYQIIAIWTAVYLCRLLFDKATAENHVRAISALIGVVTGSILVGMLTGVEPGQPRFAWGKGYFNVPIATGLIDAAEFVRGAARPGDIALVMPINNQERIRSRAVEVVSLTGVPSYLSRPAVQMLPGPRDRQVVRDRLAVLNDIEATANMSSAATLMRQAGITWYISIGNGEPRFDPTVSHADFLAGEAVVYHVK
jgi:hypothetical protein